MEPIKNAEGFITNTVELDQEQVVSERVLCPACGNEFKKWPLGWDAHAASKCSGLDGETEEDRKLDFKTKFLHLFKS